MELADFKLALKMDLYRYNAFFAILFVTYKYARCKHELIKIQSLVVQIALQRGLNDDSMFYEAT